MLDIPLGHDLWASAAMDDDIEPTTDQVQCNKSVLDWLLLLLLLLNLFF